MRFRSLPSLLAGLLVLAACSAPAPDTPPPPAVLVRSVDAAGAPPAVQVYAGEVRARIESDLGFRIGGKLVERLVDVGADVAAGAPLALLDAQDVRLAQASAQAAAAAAESDLALARSEFVRARDLQARNFVSSSVLDARRSALQAAEARLRQAQRGNLGDVKPVGGSEHPATRGHGQRVSICTSEWRTFMPTEHAET